QSGGMRGGTVARVAWRMIASPRTSSSTDDDPGESVMMAAQQTPSELEVPPPAPPQYYGFPIGDTTCVGGGPVSLFGDRREPRPGDRARDVPRERGERRHRVRVVSSGGPRRRTLVAFAAARSASNAFADRHGRRHGAVSLEWRSERPRRAHDHDVHLTHARSD